MVLLQNCFLWDRWDPVRVFTSRIITLQGTITYPTKRESRKIIDSSLRLGKGYVSFPGSLHFVICQIDGHLGIYPLVENDDFFQTENATNQPTNQPTNQVPPCIADRTPYNFFATMDKAWCKNAARAWNDGGVFNITTVPYIYICHSYHTLHTMHIYYIHTDPKLVIVHMNYLVSKTSMFDHIHVIFRDWTAFHPP